MTPLPLGEVLDFLRLVWAVDHGLQATSRRTQVRLGVTGPQRFAVRLIGRFPGMSAGQLAEVLAVHPSTVTGILTRLQRRGLVVRRKDPRDRRRSFLGLTEKGRALHAQLGDAVEEAVQQVLSSLPKSSVRGARDVLAELAAALGETGRQSPKPKAQSPTAT